MLILFVALMQPLLLMALLRSNDTELLAFQGLQAYASLPHLHELLAKEIEKSVKVAAIPNLFAQQKGQQPPAGSYQLENFGALNSWDSIMQTLKEQPNRRLLIMVRHGQAWENLNPTPNSNCEFSLGDEVIQNIDSPLTPLGIDEATSLNKKLREVASNETSKTWYETIGLAQSSTIYLSSPLSRTMQTTDHVFRSLPLSKDTGGSFVVSELLRATIGRDVCNYRRSVKTSTADNILPAPWRTGCITPTDSLEQIYKNAFVSFSFPIRPPGGAGFGLLSDADELWRADVADDGIIKTRALAILAQIYENTAPSSVIAIVTHGEMINAIYSACGEAPYSAKNTEVVPLLVEFSN